MVASGRTPVYLVHFTQQAAVERAQALLGLGLADRSRRDRIAEVIGDFRFAKGFGRTLSRMVHAGIGVHHAGMLPRYRRLVERLAQAGLLVAISGTDTLGVGINVPIRTVVLTALAKYDGRRSRLLTAREFHQIAGRAGRAGYDTAGDVVVLAPEHVIENAKVLAKAGPDPAKQRKVVRRKAPDGAVGWAEATFDRLVAAPPEPLTPHLRITHAIVMNLLARPTDIVASLRSLIEGSHEPRRRQLQLISRALSIGRSLLTSGVVIRLDAPDEYGRRFVIAEGLQLDFALDQPLSPLALAALDLLDPASPEYPLDVLSLIEATLEGPSTVLAAQRHLAKGEAIAAMKADGLEYEERMALLEDVDYPKPLADLVEVAYESYRRGHPWVAEYPPEPKAIARELFQRAMTFTEYIAFYTLARSEGVVLRYLADAYRAIASDRPSRRPHRGIARRDLLARRVGARHRLQPAGGVGGAGPSVRRRGHRRLRDPAAVGGPGHQREPAGAVGDDPQRAVPSGRTCSPTSGTRRWPIWTPTPRRTTAASAGPPRRLGRIRVGGRDGGLLGRVRRDRHRVRREVGRPCADPAGAGRVAHPADPRRPGRRP